MSRLKRKLWNRCRLLLFAPFVVAVTALLFCGTSVAGTKTSKPAKDKPKNAYEYYRIRNPKIDPNLNPRQRARVVRDAEVKRRHDARKYVQDVIQGKQPAQGVQNEQAN